MALLTRSRTSCVCYYFIDQKILKYRVKNMTQTQKEFFFSEKT